MRDLALGQLLQTLAAFGVKLHLDGLAVAAFDHGAAPPGLSDRVFRFNFLRERLAAGLGLGGFAFPREAVPPSMTRLLAIASHGAFGPAPAAHGHCARGHRRRAGRPARTHGPAVRSWPTSATFTAWRFIWSRARSSGLFEHHTGELSPARLASYVEQLGDGSITNEAVFADKGHGALVLDAAAPLPDLLAVTGPRRGLLVESGLQPYLAVPHGDMMLAGNLGLLRAYAAHDARVREAVESRLGRVPDARAEVNKFRAQAPEL